MQGWMKTLLGITLSFMCIFSCIGYAAITEELIIRGEAEVSMPDALFIKEITNVQTAGASITVSPSNISVPSTRILSEITFEKQNSAISFTATVVNATKFNHYFNVLEQFSEMEGVTGTFTYQNVEWTVSPAQGTELQPGQEMNFYITLTYKGTLTNQTRRMLHEIDFVMDSNDLTQTVSKSVTDQFEAIINNKLEEDVVYTYENKTITVDNASTYDTIINHMESSTTGGYVGNLDGADGDDKAMLDALFEEKLTFTVGNEEVPITVLAKQQQVYGNDDVNELVLYITADDLQRADNEANTEVYIPVYAVVFTLNTANQWVQTGEIIAGEALLYDYTPSWWDVIIGRDKTTGEGSFNTDYWRSTEAYYGQASGSTLETIMTAYQNTAQ